MVGRVEDLRIMWELGGLENRGLLNEGEREELCFCLLAIQRGVWEISMDITWQAKYHRSSR